MDARLKRLHKGRVWQVVALELDGICPTDEYLSGATRDDPDEVARLLARIEYVADQEQTTNKEIFRYERDKIFVFKTRGGLRLYCFQDEGRLIVTVTGANKPKKKQQQKDIDEAVHWRDRYFACKKTHPDIPIIP